MREKKVEVMRCQHCGADIALLDMNEHCRNDACGWVECPSCRWLNVEGRAWPGMMVTPKGDPGPGDRRMGRLGRFFGGAWS